MAYNRKAQCMRCKMTSVGCVSQRRQLTEDIIPQLTAEPQQAAKVLLQEIPKIAQQSIDSIPKNPKDVSSRSFFFVWARIIDRVTDCSALCISLLCRVFISWQTR